MKLNVPLVYQEEGSVDCGIAGLAMILQYYGLEGDYISLKKIIDTTNIGTYMPQLGSFLIEKGFEVEIIQLHPKMFIKKEENMEQEKVLAKLKKLREGCQKQNEKPLDYFINFLEKGGRLTVGIPVKKDFEEEIKEKRPVCALLTSNFMKGKQAGFNFHFNLVTGIDEEYIYANDPLPDERGGKQKYRINDFIYGIYASCLGDLDNASIMKIKKL